MPAEALKCMPQVAANGSAALDTCAVLVKYKVGYGREPRTAAPAEAYVLFTNVRVQRPSSDCSRGCGRAAPPHMQGRAARPAAQLGSQVCTCLLKALKQ